MLATKTGAMSLIRSGFPLISALNSILRPLCWSEEHHESISELIHHRGTISHTVGEHRLVDAVVCSQAFAQAVSTRALGCSLARSLVCGEFLAFRSPENTAM